MATAKKPAKPRKVSDLTPDGRNANRGTERGRAMLEESLRRYGAGRSILIDKNGKVIAGNKTLETAAAIGLEDVQVIQTDGKKIIAVQRMDLDLVKDKAAREMAYADNRVGQVDLDFDPEALLADVQSGIELDHLWTEQELEGLFREIEGYGQTEEGPAADVDRAAELQAKWGTERGQIWQIGRHRLMCGDCSVAEDAKVLFAGAVPDGILTDPPYSSGGFQEAGKSAGSVGTDAKHKAIQNDRLTTRGYMRLIGAALGNCDAPYLYAFTDWRMWIYLFDLAETAGYGIRSMIVWDKDTPGMGKGWRGQHELILWGCKKTPPFGQKHPGMGNVVRLNRTGNELHTTEKPVELMGAFLRNCPFIGTVYDPFLGSGTTMVAAEQNDRTAFGMEIDPGYCGVILERMSAMELEPRLI